jgi:hypothetical protein
LTSRCCKLVNSFSKILGHEVFVAADENALIAICQQHSFDIAVIGQTASPNTKLRISTLIKQHCPDVKILELYPSYAGKTLDDADSWLVVPAEEATELAERVNKLYVPFTAPVASSCGSTV